MCWYLQGSATMKTARRRNTILPLMAIAALVSVWIVSHTIVLDSSLPHTGMTTAITLTVSKHHAQMQSALPAKSASAMFALIGRDVGSELPYVLRNIGSLAVHFQQSHVVLVENDSADNTRTVFEAWGQGFTHGYTNRTAKIVTLEGQRAGKKDLSVLARARNAYIDQLSKPEYADVGFLIAVDTDMCFPWEADRMMAVINALLPVAGEAWHVLYANGVCGWYREGTPKSEEVPFNTPKSAPIYCDLFALRDTYGHTHTMTADSMVRFTPDTCDFGYMSNKSASTFSCSVLNGQSVVPVQAAFGGWAMYDASLLRGKTGCRHDLHAGGCEHLSLSRCLVDKFNATQVIATGLVVNWEGCSEKQQHRWDGWYPGRGPKE